MEHLDGIHYERFYRDLIDTAFLINEVVEGETESGDIETYYEFADAEDEAYHDGATLSEYGNAFYFKDGKEVTEWLTNDKHFFFSINSYFENSPSHLIIEAIEDSEIIQLSKEGLDKLRKEKSDVKFFKSLESKVENGVSSFFNLMVIFVLKGIVFPIFFFYILLKVVKAIWRSQQLEKIFES